MSNLDKSRDGLLRELDHVIRMAANLKDVLRLASPEDVQARPRVSKEVYGILTVAGNCLRKLDRWEQALAAVRYPKHADEETPDA